MSFFIQSHRSVLFLNALNEYLSEIVHIVQKCRSMIIRNGGFYHERGAVRESKGLDRYKSLEGTLRMAK